MEDDSRDLLKSDVHDRWIRHPILDTPWFQGIDFEHVDSLCHYRCKRLEEAWERSEWMRWVKMHVPERRAAALLAVSERMPLHEYAAAVGEMWNDPIVAFQTCDSLRNTGFFKFAREHVDFAFHAMIDSERKVFDKLPNEVVLFRAHDNYNSHDFSWTTSEIIAQEIKLARRYSRITKEIFAKNQLTAYFSRRGEHEVVLLSN